MMHGARAIFVFLMASFAYYGHAIRQSIRRLILTSYVEGFSIPSTRCLDMGVFVVLHVFL